MQRDRLFEIPMVTLQGTLATRQHFSLNLPTGPIKKGGAWMQIISRVVAAAVGGYALSSLVAIGFSIVLPMARSEAVHVGTMASFVMYVSVILWVFSTASAGRAWAGLFLCAVLLGTLIAVHQVGTLL